MEAMNGRNGVPEEGHPLPAWGYKRLWLVQRRLKTWATQPQHGSARGPGLSWEGGLSQNVKALQSCSFISTEMPMIRFIGRKN